MGDESYKILNEILFFQSCIWNTVAPAFLALRNTKADAEPSKKFALFQVRTRSHKFNLSKIMNGHLLDVYHKERNCS